MSEIKDFVHLQLHTEYSIIDGTVSLAPLFDKLVEELGIEGVARKKTPNSLSPNADPKAIETAVEFATKVKVPGHLKLAQALIRGNIFDFIAPLNCPGLIIAGSDDRSAPAEFVEQIADAYPGIDYQIIDGIGHQIAFEKPEIFVKLLRNHIDKAEDFGKATK